MTREREAGTAARWSALPRLVANAPPLVLMLVGSLALLLGLLIVTRPLTSLVILTVYVGLSAVVSGVADLAGRRATTWPRKVFAGVWIVLGVAVLVGFGRTLELLPVVLAYLLILGGLASLFDAFTRGGASRRVLAFAWAGAQIAFGVLALTWPDVTVLVVALVFGVRTILFGITTLVRAVRGFRHGTSEPAPAGETGQRRSRRVRVWAAAGRYALAALLVVTASGGWWLNDWLQDGANVVDAFYDPPDLVPYDHGRLIRSDDFVGQHPPGADVTRILYTTSDALGRAAVASALVIVPEDRPPGARPVIAWNHGTTGVARGCAPSLRDASATRWAIPGLDRALANGWIVVASDYSGQGAPGTFPYLIGRGEARSSLDAVLAARELEGSILSPRTVAWGHSQGGHAALWMSQIAEKYAPEIDIRGTAVLAPVAEPLALAEEMLQSGGDALLTILTSWVLVPYADTYADVDLTRYVATGAETIVREMTQRCPEEPGVIVSVATALGVSEDRPLYIGDLTAGALGERLAENAATGPWDTPILVTWGDSDEVIPPRLQEEFVQRLCADGEQVRWAVYSGYDHLGTLLPRSRFLPLLISWTDAVLGGRDLPLDDCHR
ncbi:lipase family protein [Microbacterium sp. NPDC055910]|uniref:lipase family protein n=1 Tax=Microbacterium sp. NPDC055910 TaxID=3345659 RepID=UPI0035E32DF8